MKPIALFIAILVSTAAPFGSASLPPQQSPAAFEVATIKPSVPVRVQAPASDGARPTASAGGSGPCTGSSQIDHNRVTISGATAYTLVAWAYGENCQLAVKADLVAGSPAWMRSEPFDIEALMPEGSPVYTSLQFRNGDAAVLQQMLQTLLADRLKLILHRETKEASVYVLTVAKNGFKLKVASAPGPGRLTVAANGNETFDRTYTVDSLAKQLGANYLDRPVLNDTGISGTFNFHLEFHSDESERIMAADGQRSSESPFPSIFTALQEQLGLKLDSAKKGIETLHIDHVEHPVQSRNDQ